MKPAARAQGGAASAQANGSQIPLPRRKGSGKSDNALDLDDTESDVSKEDFVTRGKMSLLSSTSFCCTSGQKEDYASDAKCTPKSPRKKQTAATVVAKREIAPPSTEPCTPTSPFMAAKRSFLARNKQRKSDRVVLTDYHVKDTQQSINGFPVFRKDDLSDRLHNQQGDNRLRLPDDNRKKGGSTPQQRRFLKDPVPSKSDHPEIRQQKYTEVMRKLRKDVPHYAPSNITALNVESNKLFKRNNKVIDSCSLNHNDKREVGGLMDICSPNSGAKCISNGLCDSSSKNQSTRRNMTDIASANGDKSSKVIDSSLPTQDEKLSVKSVVKSVTAKKNVLSGDTVQNSQESEDFDCPCCEKEISDDFNEQTREVKSSETENRLQSELNTLRADLQAERTRLESKQGHVMQLEQELVVMEQLKQELTTEQELRRKAEGKLLEIQESSRGIETDKRTESKATQKDDELSCNTSPFSESSSPLLLGYESRVRRYQSYIAKLEKDNHMLITELKKFKDLSPRSQEEQARELLEKVGKLEQDNRQQQMQYESCLDEVANKLVHTLLVQKRLEEECKVLHLRVEQLEQENDNLKELVKDDEKIVEEICTEKLIEEIEIKVQNGKTSHNQSSPLSPSPPSDPPAPQRPFNLSEKKPLKGTPKYPKNSSNSTEIQSPVVSPLSPGSKPANASKIPSFGSSKPVQTGQIRKKSKTENSIPKVKSRDSAMSPTTHVPNPSPMLLPPSRSKILAPTDGTKASTAKRKRASRNASPGEKGLNESKQKLRSNQGSWENDDAKLLNLCKTSSPNSPNMHFPPSPRPNQQIWSFNCTLQEARALESPRKVADSLANLAAMAETKSSVSSEDSSSTDVVHKTRDEGYSTMSSDLQPDSTTDVISEQEENTSTYLVTEKVLRCASDDSVTECLECSMSSSSDSGFGPLHRVAKSEAKNRHSSDEDDDNVKVHKKNNDSPLQNHATVKIRGPIECENLTIKNLVSQCDVFLHKSFKEVTSEKHLTPTNDHMLKDLFTTCVELELRNPPPLCTENGAKWHTDVELKSRDWGRTIVETAEKATLTEPEEETWREKALAHFIDESIWSLYSSENEIEVKHFPLDPNQQCNRSLEDLIDTSPCIVVTTEDTNVGSNSSSTDPIDIPQSERPDRQSTNGLERVASDTVLYLKDAIQELETSMMRGLKSSKNLTFKNIPMLQHNFASASDETSDWRPELIRSLESTMLRQNNLAWPSPSRSSSTSSLQSSTSCHAVSDETDDVDVVRTSRKGSQDPDLSSASDVEYENLEHKDFVERWLRKEIAQEVSPKATVTPNLEPVGELGEWNPTTFRRKTSLPNDSPEANKQPHPSRVRLMSYPTCSTPIRNRPESQNDSSFNFRNSPIFASEKTDEEYIIPATEDFESSVESETKEFNGDFYKLCSVGSLRSIDYISSFKPTTNLLRNFTKPRCSSETRSPDRQTGQSDANQNVELSPANSYPKVSYKNAPRRFTKSAAKHFLKSRYVGHHQNLPASPTVESKQSRRIVDQKSSSLERISSHGSSTKAKKSNGQESLSETNCKPTRPGSLVLANSPRIPKHNAKEAEMGDCSKMSPATSANASRIPEIRTKECTEENAARSKATAEIRPSCDNELTASDNAHSNQNSEILESNPSTKVPPSSNLTELQDAGDTRPNSSSLPKMQNAPQQKTSALLSPEMSVWSKRQQWKRDRRMARQSRMKEGCGTSWIHLQDNPDLYDPKARASLLDSLRAPTSSSGSSSSEEDDESPAKDNLSPQHKEPKEKKLAVKRRPSIVDRLGFFYRFGEREQEAISYFSFLDEIPTSSIETLNRQLTTPPRDSGRFVNEVRHTRCETAPSHLEDGTRPRSPRSKMADLAKTTPTVARRLMLPNLWNQPLSHNMSSSTLNSQDCEILDHISLSDSCAESYSSSTPDSYEEAS